LVRHRGGRLAAVPVSVSSYPRGCEGKAVTELSARNRDLRYRDTSGRLVGTKAKRWAAMNACFEVRLDAFWPRPTHKTLAGELRQAQLRHRPTVVGFFPVTSGTARYITCLFDSHILLTVRHTVMEDFAKIRPNFFS